MSDTILGDASDVVRIKGNLVVSGTTSFIGNTSGIARAELSEHSNAPYTLRPEEWHVWNAMHTPLPTTPLVDDLGIVGGAFGTDSPTIQTEDLASGGGTSYARRTFVLPPEYIGGGSITIRAHAGMLTTIADACTLDFSVYAADDEAGISADLVTTAATSINSVTLADYDYIVTPTSRVAGETLDIRMIIAVTDAATLTVVKGIVGACKIMLDVKG